MRWFLIDCSRLTERHDWYFTLIDRLADWGYDGIVLHFCDDESLAVALPGFEALASPRALSVPDVQQLIARARQRGMRLIPEIECFGHTRWLIPHPRWGACWAGGDGFDLSAVDPCDPRSLEAMAALIDATCAVFDDEIVHIGCDEVELRPLAARLRGRDPDVVWCDHVNALIALVVAKGRTPMLWADHLENSSAVLARIDRRAEVVSWHYGPDDDRSADPLRKLRDAGFTAVWAAPAVACYATRCHTHRGNLVNVARMAAHAAATGCAGTIDTLWCPFRQVRDAQFHGIAAASRIHGGGLLAAYDGDAVMRLLFTGGNAHTAQLCRDLPRLVCHNQLFEDLHLGRRDPQHQDQARETLAVGAGLAAALPGAEVDSHPELLAAMQLSARTALHCCRLHLDPAWRRDHALMAAHHQLVADLEADWDATRFADDPGRQASPRPAWDHHYLLAFLRRLGAGTAA